MPREQHARQLESLLLVGSVVVGRPLLPRIAGAERIIVADVAHGDIERGPQLLHAPVRPVTAHDERIAGSEYRRRDRRNRRIEARLEESGSVGKLLRGGQRDALVGGDETRQIERPYAFAESLRLAALQDTDDALLADEDVIDAQLA